MCGGTRGCGASAADQALHRIRLARNKLQGDKNVQIEAECRYGRSLACGTCIMLQPPAGVDAVPLRLPSGVEKRCPAMEKRKAGEINTSGRLMSTGECTVAGASTTAAKIRTARAVQLRPRRTCRTLSACPIRTFASPLATTWRIGRG